MRYINEIIIHCSATKPGQNIGAKEIREYHKNVNKWSDIGYHYVIRVDGTCERGRYISQPGAHCRGHNAHSIGVCYVGGLDADGRPCDTRTAAQKSALLKIIVSLIRLYHCPVRGHRDYNSYKACPCFDATAEYKAIYEREMKALLKK